MRDQGIVHIVFKSNPNVSSFRHQGMILPLSGDVQLMYFTIQFAQSLLPIRHNFLSQQNVVRVKHYCKNNPLKSMDVDDIERDGVLVALNSFGGNERIYAVNFYPDW